MKILTKDCNIIRINQKNIIKRENMNETHTINWGYFESKKFSKQLLSEAESFSGTNKKNILRLIKTNNKLN